MFIFRKKLLVQAFPQYAYTSVLTLKTLLIEPFPASFSNNSVPRVIQVPDIVPITLRTAIDDEAQ